MTYLRRVDVGGRAGGGVDGREEVTNGDTAPVQLVVEHITDNLHHIWIQYTDELVCLSYVSGCTKI